MYIFFCILIIVASLVLIGAVLIQKSKGGGLASDFSQNNQYLGYRKTTDFIEKATWTLAAVIVVCSILASFTVKAPVNVSSIQTTAPAPTQAAPAPANAPAAVPAAKPAAKPAAAPAEPRTDEDRKTPADMSK